MNNLSNLTPEQMQEELAYYIQDHNAMQYIAKSLAELNIDVDVPLHKWVVRTVKNITRTKNGTARLLKKLNEGSSVYIFEDTAKWLESCGFVLEYLELPPYEGNLPVEDRITGLRVRLKK